MKKKLVSLLLLSAGLLVGCGETNTSVAPASNTPARASDTAKESTKPAESTKTPDSSSAPVEETYEVTIAGKKDVVLADLFSATTLAGTKHTTGTKFASGETVTLTLTAKGAVLVNSVTAAQDDEAKTPVTITKGADEFHYSFSMPKTALTITIDAEVKPDVALDLSKLTKGDKSYSDGTFTGVGDKVELNVDSSTGATTAIKIGGNSQMGSTKKNYISFSVARKAKIHVELKSGTSNENTRVGYVASAAEDGSVDSYLVMAQLSVDDQGKALWTDMDTVLTKAGKYYILCNAAIQVRAIKIYFDDTITDASLTTNKDMAQASDNEFNAQYLLPGVYKEDHKVGNFTFKTDSEVTYYGKVTDPSSVNRYSVVLLQEGESFSFTAASAGSLSLTVVGTANDKTLTSSLTCVDASNTAVTVQNGDAIPNKSAKKSVVATVALTAAGTYTFTAGADEDDTQNKAVAIYLGSFLALV